MLNLTFEVVVKYSRPSTRFHTSLIFNKVNRSLSTVLREGPFFNRIDLFYNIANRSDDYAANMLSMIIVEKTLGVI